MQKFCYYCKYGLGIQIGAKCAKTDMHCVHIPTELLICIAPLLVGDRGETAFSFPRFSMLGEFLYSLVGGGGEERGEKMHKFAGNPRKRSKEQGMRGMGWGGVGGGGGERERSRVARWRRRPPGSERTGRADSACGPFRAASWQPCLLLSSPFFPF